MEKIKLTEQELKNFYSKYSISELEDLEGLLFYALDYDLTLAKEVLNIVQRDKVYEGDTFYDKNLRIKELTDKELDFLHDVVSDANQCFQNVDEIDYSDERKSSGKLLYSIEKELEERELNRNIKPSKKLKTFGLSESELIELYNKYNPFELKELGELFEFVYDYDYKMELDLLKKTIYKKSKEYSELEKPTSFSIVNLTDKNNLLNDKERKFLYDVANSHFDGIMSERDIPMEGYIENISLFIGSLKKPSKKLTYESR